MPDVNESWLIQRILRFLTHLERGGARPQLPERKERALELERFVHPSSLLDCPLRAALSQTGAKPYIPELLPQNRPYLSWIFEYGRRTASIIQEALLWPDPDDTVIQIAFAEVFMQSDQLHLRGSVDIFALDHRGHLHVFELKHKGFPWMDGKRTSQAAPAAGDCYQAMAYAMLLAERYGLQPEDITIHLIMIDKEPKQPTQIDGNPGIHLWDLTPGDAIGLGNRDSGVDLLDQLPALYGAPGTFVLLDSTTQAYPAEWNQSHFLSFDKVRAEIARQLVYIDGARDCPIPDPVNHPQGYECLQKVQYPTGDRKGMIAPRCQFSCHFKGADSKTPFWKSSDGNGYVAVYEKQGEGAF